MRKYSFGKWSCFSIIIVFFCTALPAQNIVEYFGKEKINDVQEGKVAFTFKKGLVLSTGRSSLNSVSFPTDVVFKNFLMTHKTVSEGEVAYIDPSGNAQKWTSVQVNDKSTFETPALRGGYMYLTYRSDDEKVVLFEASGHTKALINGFPHEGDHYDFGYSLIPIKLKRGTNVFVLKGGRFPRIRARLITPRAPIIFTKRDMTLPDLLIEESIAYKGAVRIINATENWIRNYKIRAYHDGKDMVSKAMTLPPMSVRKVPFDIPVVWKDSKLGKSQLGLELQNSRDIVMDSQEIDIDIKSKYGKHKRTFISKIDGSVQYFSVAPSSVKDLKNGALFLSVHGASVEAVNQANAYKQKDWGHIVAPTNRRPFGFAWEDWGRLDALEVLAEGKRIYDPDPTTIYLTGHSMGGHGTWYLGATYPDKFAAIAPCAGYPDLLGYRDSFVKRALKASPEQLKNWGITEEALKKMAEKPQLTDMDHMIKRAGNPSRTLKLRRNYLQQGVYILHGEKDNVVPTFIAREMREELGKFHNDFTYYEYPGGTHWYGDHSMDWPPIFDLFKQRTIKHDSLIDKMEFYTASPGVSAQSRFVTIYQQQKPFEISAVNFSKEEGLTITTENVQAMAITVDQIAKENDTLVLDGGSFAIPQKGEIFFDKSNGSWQFSEKPSLKKKGPHRNGGFKDAFTNNVVFVYATQGDKTENRWYYNKALSDAEAFYYRANGSVELVPDKDFNPKEYSDQNVVVYGNNNNNAAWKKLLKNAPVQVGDGKVMLGGREVRGEQWGLYFIVPRPDSDTASVGVVTATGKEGMKAIYPNHYLLNGTTFPDLLLFNNGTMQYGTDAVKCAGFFGNDWSFKNGDFQWQ